MGRLNEIDEQLKDASLRYVVARSREYMGKQLSGRIVLEFYKGTVTQIFDQPSIKGASQLAYYLEKIE